MKSIDKLKTAAITSVLLGTSLSLAPMKTMAQIGETTIDQNSVVAVAIPGGRFYNLAIVQQIPGKKTCWSESGSQPTVINPLWNTFDFTGSCNRASDSNGYSVRVDGQDTSLEYSLDLVERGDEVQLVAMNRRDRSRSVIGTTNGKADGQFLKINLKPGWEFSKKTFQGKTLGHFFVSGTSQAIASGKNTTSSPRTSPPDVVTAKPSEPITRSSFTDIAGDIYKNEIEKAVSLGFVAGFKDNTFKPTQPLTREQVVSMVIGALGTVPDLGVKQVTSVITKPYPDVSSSRWSAAKIQWAKDNGLVKGYPDGTFKPERPVTRAELMAILQNATKYSLTKQGKNPELSGVKTPTAFTDISSHWGQNLILTMSSFCNVASPYNESGNSFLPDNPSGRNYAAAATLRMHNCIANPGS